MAAPSRLRREFRLFPPGVVDDELVGGHDDGRRATEVCRQLHHLAVEVPDQRADPANVGAVPFVDRLVVVGHGEELAEVPVRHAPEERVLGAVGVLKLVHEPVAVNGLIVPRHGGVLEESVRLEDERVEVQGVGAGQLVLVEPIGASHAGCLVRLRDVPGGKPIFSLFRPHQPGLQAVDPR